MCFFTFKQLITEDKFELVVNWIWHNILTLWEYRQLIGTDLVITSHKTSKVLMELIELFEIIECKSRKHLMLQPLSGLIIKTCSYE